MKKIILILCLCLGLCGCSKENKSGESSNTESKTDEVETIEVEEISYNNDEEGMNFSMEIDQIIGHTIIFKVVNDSSNCYENVIFSFYFVPGENTGFYLEDGYARQGGNRTGYIPAYSTSYFAMEVPSYEVYKDKEDTNPTCYYINTDSLDYRIEITSYTLSDYLVQDASSYIKFEEVNDYSNNIAGNVTNPTNRNIICEFFLICDDQVVALGGTDDLYRKSGYDTLGTRIISNDTKDILGYNLTGKVENEFEYETMYDEENYAFNMADYSNCKIFLAKAYFDHL